MEVGAARREIDRTVVDHLGPAQARKEEYARD
jgi:hypothetical protein